MSDTPTIETIQRQAPSGATHYHTGLKKYYRLMEGKLYSTTATACWNQSAYGLLWMERALENGEMLRLAPAVEEEAPTHHPAAPVLAEFIKAAEDKAHPYHGMAHALLSGFEQAALGKGKKRHANNLPFEKQRMQSLADGQGHMGGIIYQICKKAEECEHMEPAARKHELAGVLVYACGGIIWTDRHEGDNDA